MSLPLCREVWTQGSEVEGSSTWYKLVDGTYVAASFVKTAAADIQPCEPGATGSADNEAAGLAPDEQQAPNATSDDPAVLGSATTEANESILFVIDTSRSMLGARLEQAKGALRQGITALTSTQAAGLRNYPASFGCSDGGRLIVPIGIDNRPALQSAVNGLVASGTTPTPAALRAAVADLPTTGSRTIVFISDGESQCGDPCPVARELVASSGVKFTVQTVGFNASGAAPAQLQCIADATGGRYFEATDGPGLAEAIKGAIPGGTNRRYVALGDSFSAGEGNFPFIAGTDIKTKKDKNVCHRSEDAYGPQLANRLGFSGSNFAFGACSGAILPHISESVGGVGQWEGKSQLDTIAPFGSPSTNTSLVTLTIGGNDIGFADGLKSCIRGTGKNQLFHGDCKKTLNRLAEPGLQLLEHGGTIQIDPEKASWKFCNSNKGKCTDDKHLVTANVADLAGMLGKIRDRAPNARILVPLYPHLFPENPPDKCRVGQAENRVGKVFSYTIDKSDADRFNQLGDDLDSVLMEEVRQAQRQGINVDYVETRDAFYGHSIRCIDDITATRQPWINGLILEDATKLTATPSPYSFHPNAEGHRGFSRLIQRRLDDRSLSLASAAE